MDTCPICGVETMIAASHTEAAAFSPLESGGGSPRVKVYQVQALQCRNPGCANFGKTVEERRHLLFDGVPNET